MRKLLLTMTSVLLPVAAAATFVACEGVGSGGGSGSTGTTVTTEFASPTSTTVSPDDDTTT
jgi:hypothetical protein